MQWVWPSSLSYETRHEVLKRFTLRLAEAWAAFDVPGHPLESGHAFQEQVLPDLFAELNGDASGQGGAVPWLAALVCCSPFDLALHDAYGQMHRSPVYDLYGPPYVQHDLARYLASAADSDVEFEGTYPCDFLSSARARSLFAWHLVGGLDPLDASELAGDEPDDGYPVTLQEWVRRDGLRCLKVKLRGVDADWDYRRLVRAVSYTHLTLPTTPYV